MVLIASTILTYLIWAVGVQVSRSSLTTDEDHFYLNEAKMAYFRLTDGSGYESYICLGCIFPNKVIWPAVSSSSMLFPMVLKFARTLWTLTIYCYTTFWKKERKHIVLKIFLSTFGGPHCYKSQKHKCGTCLKSLWCLFALHLFPGNTPNSKGKGNRGCSDYLYIYGANMTFNKLFWECWTLLMGLCLLVIHDPWLGSLLQWSWSVDFLVPDKVSFCDTSGTSGHAESFSLVPHYEKPAENYLWGFYLSLQLRWAMGFKSCVYTLVHSGTTQALLPEGIRLEWYDDSRAARDFRSEISQTDRFRRPVSEADFSFDFKKSCFLKEVMDFFKWKNNLLKVLSIFFFFFFKAEYQPLDITKQRAFLRMQD